MKKLVSNYTFNAAAKTIAFNDYTSIDLEGVLLITNVTRNTIIYNFADPSLGGGISGNTITLLYNTADMSNSDALQIYYDDSSITPATDESILLMRRILKAIEPLSVQDVAQRQRINIDGGVGTITNNPMFIRVTDGSGNTIIQPGNNSFASNTMWVVPDTWKFIDAARLNYQQAIRANLTF